MIRKFMTASVAAITMAGSAFAADLPSRKAPPPVYVPPPPIFTWTGFYVGVNAGGSFGGSNSIITATPIFAARTFANEAATSALLASSNNLNNNNRISFIGGGQL